MSTDQLENVDQDKKTAVRKNWPSAERKQDGSLDELFRRLQAETGDPGEKKASEVMDAVQRLVLQMDAGESVGAVAESLERRSCQACGGLNPADNRFCAKCGVPLDAPAADASKHAPSAGQHHYHHHYHHHYFAAGDAVPSSSPELRPAPPLNRDLRLRTPAATGPSRAEIAVRKLSQDWALACNTKHLDDLVSLYAADATAIRPNVPPVRTAAAIREFFFAALEAGFGEVEMESMRVEILGDVAYDMGRCTMLVPGVTGKRREERGKYVLLAARQAGEWKIVLDSWTTDLSLATDAAATKPQSPASRPNIKSA